MSYFDTERSVKLLKSYECDESLRIYKNQFKMISMVTRQECEVIISLPFKMISMATRKECEHIIINSHVY